MSTVTVTETTVTLTAGFDFGRPPWSCDHGDDGKSNRYIDIDVVIDLLRRMLLPTDNKPLPKHLTLNGASAVNIDLNQNWNRKGYVSIEVSPGTIPDPYGVGWKNIVSSNLKSVVTKFCAMCSTPGALKWWELQRKLEKRLNDLKECRSVTVDEYMEEVKRIHSDPEFKAVEPPDFIGDVLLATKFAELDVAITGKKPQGCKEYPFRFASLHSDNLIYLNDGGYSRLGLFISTDDTLRLHIYTNEKSDHRGRQHDDDVTAKMREIQEAATAWYRAAVKAQEAEAVCRTPG